MFKHFRIGGRGTLLTAFIAVFIATMIGLAVGPRVPDATQQDYCVQNLRTDTVFGLSMNCDSFDFMRLADFPSGLLAPNNVRQARPGMIFAAYLLAKPFLGLRNVPAKLKVRISTPWITTDRLDWALGRNFP